MQKLHIVFDGPPGPECGRFVEVEQDDGSSVSVGEWHDRGNGLHALVIDDPRPLRAEVERLMALIPGQRGTHKPPPWEWRGNSLMVDGDLFGNVSQKMDGWSVERYRHLDVNGIPDEATARALMMVLANHDPGGTWRIDGYTVPAGVVRAAHRAVMVTWDAAT